MAMGYRNRFLSRVVLFQAVILALMGFLPGLLIAEGLYSVDNVHYQYSHGHDRRADRGRARVVGGDVRPVRDWRRCGDCEAPTRPTCIEWESAMSLRFPPWNFRFSRRTPLAWRNLTYNRRRLAVALCGIGFAVVLMFAETGFENALFDSQVQVFDELNADLILSSSAYKALVSERDVSQGADRSSPPVPGREGRVSRCTFNCLGTMWKGPG